MTSHKDELYEWLRTNRPEVFARLDADGVSDIAALHILNAETRIQVPVLERVEVGSRRFLEAFKTQGDPKVRS